MVLAVIIMLFSTVAIVVTNIFASNAFAQLVPNFQVSPKVHGVKIISPINNEKIALKSAGDNDLTISGTSLDNATSNCQVSVIVNDIKPYHEAAPTGGYNRDDY